MKKLLIFDANKDGKLEKDELKDRRLHALFERADTNKDGVATREELEALFAKEATAGGGGFGPFDPKDKGPDFKGKGPDKGKGPKGPPPKEPPPKEPG